jgi:hypothetical protein
MAGRIIPEPSQPDRDPEPLAEQRELARSARSPFRPPRRGSPLRDLMVRSGSAGGWAAGLYSRSC